MATLTEPSRHPTNLARALVRAAWTGCGGCCQHWDVITETRADDNGVFSLEVPVNDPPESYYVVTARGVRWYVRLIDDGSYALDDPAISRSSQLPRCSGAAPGSTGLIVTDLSPRNGPGGWVTLYGSGFAVVTSVRWVFEPGSWSSHEPLEGDVVSWTLVSPTEIFVVLPTMPSSTWQQGWVRFVLEAPSGDYVSSGNVGYSVVPP